MEKLYGEWLVGAAGRLSRADHIRGARVVSDGKGRPAWVVVQYQEAGSAPVEVEMDFPNALFLLSLLKSLQLDSGVPFPDDPRR